MNSIFARLTNCWRTSKKGVRPVPLLAALLFLSLPVMLSGCSGGGPAAAPAAGASSSSTTTNNGYTLYLNTDKTSIATDNSDSATITATVIKDNVAQEGVTVSFVTTAGTMSFASRTTDSKGEAFITLKSGPRVSNQVALVSVSNSGASTSVPVQITGNTMTLTIPQTNMAVAKTQTLTALLQNAKPVPISQAPVSFTVLSGGSFISLSSTSGTSDSNGKTTTTITGVAPGTATILVNGLEATAQIDITVAAAAQVFEISSPTTTTTTMATDETLDVEVNAPTQANVTFSTTVGILTETGNPGNTGNTITVPVVSKIAKATLSSSDTGLAGVTVLDPNNGNNSDTLEVSIYAPASQAATIRLDSSLYNMPVSVAGGIPNSAFLTATVSTAPTTTQPSGGVVGGAQVIFTITQQPGGGEKVSPGIVTTDSTGMAKTTFYSGILETGGNTNGVQITATIAGTTISKSVIIMITDRPGSIVIGPSLALSGTDVYYEQEIQVSAVHGDGTPAANKTIYLKLWPTYYIHGYWTVKSADDPICVDHYTSWPYIWDGISPIPAGHCANSAFEPNEDVNMNLALDAGEDTGPMGTPDQALTPPNAAAGTIPASVTTDATGYASFKIKYFKQYANWLWVHLEASTSVQMTENVATTEWQLGVTAEDTADCKSVRRVFDSPFHYTMCN